MCFWGWGWEFFFGIVVSFILRGCISPRFRSLFFVSSSRSMFLPTPHPTTAFPPPVTHICTHVCNTHSHGCVAWMPSHMCMYVVPEGYMCECMSMGLRRGLNVAPAVGINRVSGRARQQAAAACSHYKPDSLGSSKDHNWRLNTCCPLQSSPITTFSSKATLHLLRLQALLLGRKFKLDLRKT